MAVVNVSVGVGAIAGAVAAIVVLALGARVAGGRRGSDMGPSAADIPQLVEAVHGARGVGADGGFLL